MLTDPQRIMLAALVDKAIDECTSPAKGVLGLMQSTVQLENLQGLSAAIRQYPSYETQQKLGAFLAGEGTVTIDEANGWAEALHYESMTGDETPSDRDLMVSLVTPGGRLPQRGDAVDAWLKRMRDRHNVSSTESYANPATILKSVRWEALNELLDRYRECSCCGLTLQPEDDDKGYP